MEVLALLHGPVLMDMDMAMGVHRVMATYLWCVDGGF